MENKEFKVIVPDGYEIDVENSTFECIKFRPKKLTYEEIAKELFENKSAWWYSAIGMIVNNKISKDYEDPDNATSEKQVKKLLALNKLLNVAKYLNGDWVPDLTKSDPVYQFELNFGQVRICSYGAIYNGVVGFKSEELAKQAIQILGEDTIKLALSVV